MTTPTALVQNVFTPMLIAGMTWKTALLIGTSVVVALFLVWFFLLRGGGD